MRTKFDIGEKVYIPMFSASGEFIKVCGATVERLESSEIGTRYWVKGNHCAWFENRLYRTQRDAEYAAYESVQEHIRRLRESTKDLK